MGLLTESCCCWLHLPFSWKGSQHAVFKTGTFYSTSCDLADVPVKIARGGFKWCSPVLSAGSVPHHQVVWKYPLPLFALLGVRWVCDGRSWSLALLQLLFCPENTYVSLHGLEWGGKLNFVAIQSKTVMETAKFRVCNSSSVWADLFWG